MPRPVYVLCCESMTIDTFTGLASYINAYDTLTVVVIPLATVTPPAFQLKMRISSLWALNPGEPLNRKYEHQFVIRGPQESPPIPPPQVTPFDFIKDFQRFDGIVQGQPFSVSGIYHMESRLREIGQGDWIIQDFPLRVQVVQHRLDFSAAEPPPTPPLA